MKRSLAHWSLRLGQAASLALAPFCLSACAVSHFSNPFHSSSQDPGAGGVTADRLLENAKADSGSGDMVSGSDSHCPQVVSWPNDRILTVYLPGHVGDNLSIVHRGEITKVARDCTIASGYATVKYGFAGRVLLGPKGQAGTVMLPISIHVAGPDHKVLSTDMAKIPVTVPSGNPVGYFSLVKEISFPVETGARPEDYKIFLAFEHTQAGAG